MPILASNLQCDIYIHGLLYQIGYQGINRYGIPARTHGAVEQQYSVAVQKNREITFNFDHAAGYVFGESFKLWGYDVAAYILWLVWVSWVRGVHAYGHEYDGDTRLTIDGLNILKIM